MAIPNNAEDEITADRMIIGFLRALSNLSDIHPDNKGPDKKPIGIAIVRIVMDSKDNPDS